MTEGFNLNAILGTDIVMTTNTQKLPLNSLKPNPKNFYELRNIDELADDIATNGLLQNLVVQDNNDGTYMIIVGHRRYEALKQLVSQGYNKFNEVDCLVLSQNENEDLTELKLHTSNITTRQLTPAETMQAIQRIKEIITSLKEQDYPIRGKMRDIIADQMGLSPTQVQKYTNVANNDELREAVVNNELSIEEAAEKVKEVQAEGSNKNIKEKKKTVSSFRKKVVSLKADVNILARAKPVQIKQINRKLEEITELLNRIDPPEEKVNQ